MIDLANIPLEDIMVKKRASIDPSKHADETFDLYSVPAFDDREPERIPGSEIGSSKKSVEPGDVLLSRIVPHIRRAWVVGEASGNRQIGSGEWMIFKGKDVWPEYLRHLLVSDWFHPRLMQTVSGVGGSLLRARPAEVARIEVPIPHKNGKPDLDEQKRIAAILDKADAIRRKRQQALRLTDDFLRSVFLDLFGDPVTNPKGWKMGELGDLVARLDGGKNLAEAPSETETRVLKVSAVTSGEYKAEESKFVPESFVVPESYIVRKGDLLVSRANTRELIGATAYVWETPENIMLPDKIWKFIWKAPDQVDPLFVHSLMRFPGIQAEVGRRASGSSGSMKNIAKPKYLGVPIPIPPSDLQIVFGDIGRKLRSTALRINDPKVSPDSLFSSLQQRAFRGEL